MVESRMKKRKYKGDKNIKKIGILMVRGFHSCLDIRLVTTSIQILKATSIKLNFKLKL